MVIAAIAVAHLVVSWAMLMLYAGLVVGYDNLDRVQTSYSETLEEVVMILYWPCLASPPGSFLGDLCPDGWASVGVFTSLLWALALYALWSLAQAVRHRRRPT